MRLSYFLSEVIRGTQYTTFGFRAQSSILSLFAYLRIELIIICLVLRGQCVELSLKIDPRINSYLIVDRHNVNRKGSGSKQNYLSRLSTFVQISKQAVYLVPSNLTL